MGKVTFLTIEGREIELDRNEVLFTRMKDGNNAETTRLCLSENSDREDVIVVGTPDEITARFDQVIVEEQQEEAPKVDPADDVLLDAAEVAEMETGADVVEAIVPVIEEKKAAPATAEAPKKAGRKPKAKSE